MCVLATAIVDTQVVHTSEKLADKIKHHIPKTIRTGQFYQDCSVLSRSCKLSNHYFFLDSTIVAFCIVNFVPFNSIMIDSLCLLLVALLFIFLP